MRLFLCVLFIIFISIDVAVISHNQKEIQTKIDKIVELQEQQIPKIEYMIITDTIGIVEHNVDTIVIKRR